LWAWIMAMRPVDGPGKGKYVSTDVAAEWLGISDHTFENLTEQFDWLRPIKIGRRTVWDWFDVVVVGHILKQRHGVALEVKSEKKSEGQGGPRKATEGQGRESDPDVS
jgi:hypothetical protein